MRLFILYRDLAGKQYLDVEEKLVRGIKMMPFRDEKQNSESQILKYKKDNYLLTLIT